MRRGLTTDQSPRAGGARGGERGFALLLVFLMAAAIAIALYMEIPRAAFEAERQREERLVDIGKEYQRAIQLYVRETKKFPADLDELAKPTNNKRFLRHKYIDPMTNKDEWRLIHANNTGDFIDSKKKNKDKDKKDSGPNAFITEGAHVGQEALGSSATGGPEGPVVPALRQRPSDRTAPMRPGDPSTGTGQPGQPGQSQIDPTTGLPVAGQGQPGQPTYPIGMRPPGMPGGAVPGSGQTAGGQTGTSPPGAGGNQAGYTGGISVLPGLGSSGVSAQPGLGSTSGGGTAGAGPYGGGAQASQFGQPGGGTFPGGVVGGVGSGPNPGLSGAVKDIMTGLTRPNPQGAPPGMMGAGGALLAGGLAGIASNYKAKGIKIIGDTQQIDEWEFVYDFKKDMQSKIQGALPQPSNRNPLGPSSSSSSSSSSDSSGTPKSQ